MFIGCLVTIVQALLSLGSPCVSCQKKPLNVKCFHDVIHKFFRSPLPVYYPWTKWHSISFNGHRKNQKSIRLTETLNIGN